MLKTWLASGIFKFSNKIDPELLANFVRANWENNPDFLELYIRGCDGEKKFGIGFKYRHEGSKEEFEKFLDQCVGILTRVFHHDLRGWDISSSTYIIK